ncbi:MAG: hypothetical protein FD174_40 [Geobacteraceae bacterium]|nr:MAG: hypothetical protein FD174_40 [Geobacteraceae bacterium]
MSKRILFFLTLILLGSSGPGFPPVVARFVPIPVAAALAAPLPSPAVEGGESVPPESLQAPSEETETEEEEEEEEEETEGLGEQLEEILEESEVVIDETHARISHGLLATAEWFDSFFADERVVSECQRSHLKLGLSALIKEREDVKYDARLNFRLEMPVLKNRVNFLLAGDEEENEFQPAPLQEVRQQFLDANRESFFASLRYFFESTLDRSISLQVGIRFPRFVPTPFLEPRYRQNFAFSEWLLRFNQRVIALVDYTMEVRTTVDLDRPINDKMLFRHTFDGSWFSEQHGYFYDVRFTTFHRLNPRIVMEYQWNNFFRTSPNHNLEEIRLRVLYRQQFWRKWLFFEVAPQLTFPRDRDYKYTPGVLLRLETIFGSF